VVERVQYVVTRCPVKKSDRFWKGFILGMVFGGVLSFSIFFRSVR
jgi:hypothetical protein